MSRRLLWALPVIASCIAMFSVSAQERGRGRGATVTLPDGAGREIVQEKCAACHALSLITNSGYSREEWVSVFTTMVALPPDQASAVGDYLAKNFPEKPHPEAKIIPGNVIRSRRPTA